MSNVNFLPHLLNEPPKLHMHIFMTIIVHEFQMFCHLPRWFPKWKEEKKRRQFYQALPLVGSLVIWVYPLLVALLHLYEWYQCPGDLPSNQKRYIHNAFVVGWTIINIDNVCVWDYRRTTSVGLPVVISHTQNTTQVVDSMMGYVIISPLSANIKVTPAARLLAH